MAQQKIIYGIDFQINKQKLKDLQNELTKISKMKLKDFMELTGKDTEQARKLLGDLQDQARSVSKALEAAFNPKLNTVNIQKFNAVLKSSGTNLNKIRQNFQQMGPEGQRQFANLQASIYKTGKAVKETHKWLDKMGTTLSNSIKWAASSALINGFTRSIQQAWGFTKSLDSSLNDIRIVTRKSTEEMEKFAKQANAAAFNLGRTTTDYTKASLIYAQQGLGDKEIAARADVTLKAANVTGQSAEQVSEELTAVWNGYKVSADEAELYVDKLAAVASSTASNLEELSKGMSKVAAAAATLGVNEDQLASQLSTIISVTRQAPETVGVALKTVYARITDIKAGIEEDGTTLGQYSSKLAEMGINVLDTTGNLRNMGTVIEEVGNKWSTFSKEQQVYIAQTMAGQRQYSNLIALFDNFDKYNDSMKVAGEAAGTLQKQQDIYMDSIEAHLNQLTAAKEEFFQSFTDPKQLKPLIDIFTALTKGAGLFIESIGGGIGAFRNLGTIGLTVLNDKISKSLQTTISNFTNAKMVVQDMTNKIDDMNNKINNNKIKDGQPEISKEEKEWAQNQKRIYELGLQSGGTISSERIEQLEGMNNNLRQLKIDAEEAQQQLNQVETSIKSYIATSKDLQGQNIDVKDFLNNKNYDEARSSFVKKLQELVDDQFNPFLDTLQAKILKIKKQAQTMLSSNEPSDNLEKIKVSIKWIKDNIDSIGTKIKEARENGIIDDKEADKVSEALKKMQQAITKAHAVEENGGSQEEIATKWKLAATAMTEYNNAVEQVSKKIQTLNENINAGAESTYKKAEQTSKAAQTQEEVLEKTFKSQSLQNYAQNLTNVVTGLTQLGNGMENIKNIGNIWNSNDSDAYKFFKTITTGISGITSFILGATRLNSTLKNLNIRTKEKQQVQKQDTVVTQQNNSAQQQNTNLTNRNQKEKIKLSNAIKKIKQEIQKLLNITAQENAEEMRGVTVDNARVSSLERLKNAFKKAKDAGKKLFDSVGIIGIAGAVVTAIQTVTSAINAYYEQLNQTDEQARESKLELANTTLQALDKEKTFLKQAQKLNQQLKEGEISRLDLQTAIQSLGKEYDIENSKIQTLIHSYNDLNSTINKMQQENFSNQVTQNKIKTGLLAQKINKEKFSEYTDIAKQLNLSGGAAIKYNPSSIREKKLLEEKYGQDSFVNIDQQTIEHAAKVIKDNTSYGKIPGTEIDIKGSGISTALGLILGGIPGFVATEQWLNYNSQNDAAIKYANAMVRQVKFNTFEEQMQAYGNALQDYEEWKQQGQEGLAAATLGWIQSLAAGGVKQAYDSLKEEAVAYTSQQVAANLKDLSKIQDTQDYVQIVSAIDKRIAESYSISQADRTSILTQALNDLSPESYQKYGNVLQLAAGNAKLNLLDAPKKIGDLLNSLDSKHLNKLFELSPTTIDNWDDVTNMIDKIKDVTIPTPFNEAEITAVADEFQKIEDAISKIRSGKKITVKEFKELGISDDLKKQFFRQGLGGYEMVGDQRQFEAAMRSKAAESTYELYKNAKFEAQQLNSRRGKINDDAGENLITQKHQQANAYLSAIEQESYLQWETDANGNEVLDANGKRILLGNSGTQEFGGATIKLDSKQEMQKAAMELMVNFLRASSFQAENGSGLLQKYIDDNNYAAIAKAYKDYAAELNFLDEDHIQKLLNNAVEDAKQSGRLLYENLFPTDTDLKDTDIYQLKLNLKEITNLSEDIAEQLAESILRFNHAAADVNNKLIKWKDNLQNGIIPPLQELRNTFSDFLGLSANNTSLSKEFLTNAYNLDLMQQALLGSVSAYKELQNAAQQDMFSNFKSTVEQNWDQAIQNINSNTETRSIWEKFFNEGKVSQDSFFSNFNTNINNLKESIKNKKIGEELNEETQTIIKNLIQIFNMFKLSSDMINDFFAAQGIAVQISGKLGEFFLQNNATVAADLTTKLANSSEAQKALDKERQRIKNQKTLEKLLKNQKDLYHDINNELKDQDRLLSRLQKKAENTYGKQLISNLRKQNKSYIEQNELLKEKTKIQKKDLANKRDVMKKQYGFTFNENGNIANYEQIIDHYTNDVNYWINKQNEIYKRMNVISQDSDEYKQLDTKLSEITRKKNQANTNKTDVEKAISDYEKIQDQHEDTLDAIEEKLRNQIANNVQLFDLKVSLHLDMATAQKEWNDFKRNVIERDDVLNQNVFSSKIKNSVKARADYQEDATSLLAINENITTAEKELKKLQNGETSVLFNNQGQALAKLEELKSTASQTLLNMAENMDIIKQNYLDTMDNIQTELFNKQNGYFNFIENQIEHDKKLIELVYGDKAYEAKEKLFDISLKNEISNVDNLKKQIDFWAEQQVNAIGDTAKQKAHEQWQAAIADYNAAVETTAQTLKDKYENAIESIFNKLTDALTNGKGFDYLDTEWDLMKKHADLYLDTVNSAFAIKETETSFQEILNNTDGLRSQQQLKKVMDQQLEILKEKDKLTQYDVDRASKVLEIEKARIALEEARNNKTSMRLKRDSSGNYSYQFTANQDQINKAESELLKVEQNLYNFDKENYENKLKEGYDVYKEYQEKTKSLAIEYATATQKRKKQILEQSKLLETNYNNYIINIAKEAEYGKQNLMSSTFESLFQLQNKEIQNFQSLSDTEKEIFMQQLVPTINSGIEEMIGKIVTNPDSFIAMITDGFKNIQDKTKIYQSELKNLQETAGISLSNIAKGTEPILDKEALLLDNNDKMIETAQKIASQAAITTTAIDNIATSWKGVKNSTVEAINKIIEYKKEAAKAGLVELDKKGNVTAIKSPVNVSPNNPTGQLPMVDKTITTLSPIPTSDSNSFVTIPPSNTLEEKEEQTNPPSALASDFKNLTGLDWEDRNADSNETLMQLLLGAFQEIEFEHKSLKGELKTTYDKAFESYRWHGGNLKDTITDAVYMKFLKRYLKAFYPFHPQFLSFLPKMKWNEEVWNVGSGAGLVKSKSWPKYDTGGYTGNWNSSDGRLAVLHEKELILNKNDTANMLKIIQASRNIIDMVQSNVLSVLSSQIQQLNSTWDSTKAQVNKYNQETVNNRLDTQKLNQQVSIEANFPNVTNKTEIQEAFSDLVNLATQKALNYNKN